MHVIKLCSRLEPKKDEEIRTLPKDNADDGIQHFVTLVPTGDPMSVRSP